MKRAADEAELDDGPSQPPRPWKKAVRGKCDEVGCPAEAFFGVEGDERASRCGKHRLHAMVNIASARCAAEGCSKQPHYGPEGTKDKTHCAPHGKPLGFVDNASKRCAADGCEMRPSYGVKGTKKATHCATHGEPLGLVNVVSPRCTAVECETIAIYGPKGTNERTHCATHGEPLGLVDVVSPRCTAVGCETIARYGPKGTKTMTHCAVHGEPLGLVDVAHPRCAADGCETIPTFGVKGTKMATRCATHMAPDMENVVSARCIGCDGHPCWSKRRAYYGGRHCYYCADDSELKVVRKKTEARCMKRVRELLGDLVTVTEQLYVDFRGAIDPPRTRAFVDAELSHSSIRVLLEIDECRHAREDAVVERERVRCVEEVLRRSDPRPIAWVRFNPDDGTEPASARDQVKRCGEAVEAIRALIESPENRIIHVNYE